MSAATVLTELYDLAPSLDTGVTADEERHLRFIARAMRRVNEDGGGGEDWDSYDTACAYLAWHLLLASGMDDTGDEARGAIVEEKTDNATVKYQPVVASDYSTSVPGREFLALQATRIVDPWVLD